MSSTTPTAPVAATTRGALLLVLAIGAALVTACSSSPPVVVQPGSPSVPSTSDSSRSVPPRVLLGPMSTVGSGYTLDLLDGAKTVEVQAADLHGHLYRVETTAGSAGYPNVRVEGTNTLQVTLQGDVADLSVQLDESTPWTLRFSAGISTLSVDMGAGTLRALTALQGISTLDITAGHPVGDVVLTEAAGVSAFAVHVPTSTPVTVEAAAGAGSITLFGAAHQGVPAGARFSTSSGTTADGYVVQAEGGVGTLVVDAS